MDEKLKIIESQIGELRIKRNINLSEYFFSKRSCLADALFIATSTKELIRIIGLCDDLGVKYLIFGMGSKIVVEKHFLGIAIKNRSRNIKIFGIKGKISRQGLGIEHAFIQADSGCTLSELSDFSVKQGLAGFEVLSSAGTIGGSILSDYVIRSKTDKIEIILGNGQTEMIGLENLKPSNVITSVIFKLKARV